MTIGNKTVQSINPNTYVAYKQDKEKTDLDNIRIVQIKDLPVKNNEIIEVMFPYMNNTVPIIKLVDRFYSYIDVRDELEDEVEDEIEDELESLEEDLEVNSKGEQWDEVFPTIDGVMDVNDFNQMLHDMRHFYDR